MLAVPAYKEGFVFLPALVMQFHAKIEAGDLNLNRSLMVPSFPSSVSVFSVYDQEGLKTSNSSLISTFSPHITHFFKAVQ